MEANVAIEPNNSNKQSQNIDETTTERTTRVTDDHQELGVGKKIQEVDKNKDNENTNMDVDDNYKLFMFSSIVEKTTPMFDTDLLEESDSELAPAIIGAEEVLLTKYKEHVDQFVNMREHVKKLV